MPKKSALPAKVFGDDLAFFTRTLKMRLDMIYSADNPEVAVLSAMASAAARRKPGASRHHPHPDRRPGTASPAAIAAGGLNGTIIEIDELDPPPVLPADRAPWRAGWPTRRPG
ncbi:MAG: hypothetical protein U1E16_04675 [Hyphomicrobiales bacterium]